MSNVCAYTSEKKKMSVGTLEKTVEKLTSHVETLFVRLRDCIENERCFVCKWCGARLAVNQILCMDCRERYNTENSTKRVPDWVLDHYEESPTGEGWYPLTNDEKAWALDRELRLFKKKLI